MACSQTPLSGDSDCGFLCLCVCKCERRGEWQPKCPNLHIYNLDISVVNCTVTDAGGSLDEVLLSMVQVASDQFIWTRPRLPDESTVGNVTIKTAKTLSELEGGCTATAAQGPSGALDVLYMSITTDTGQLVYEWDEDEGALCKTSGPASARISSVQSNWSVVPAGGADLCCMPRKVCRRIWDQDTADADGYTLTFRSDSFIDGDIDSCGEAEVNPGSCACYNEWEEESDDSETVFGDLVDGFYLSAHFETQSLPVLPGGGDGKCGEVTEPAVCGVITRDCDATSNLNGAPATADFGPSENCNTRQQRPLFNRDCGDCECDPLTFNNVLQSPVFYTHITDCCEYGYDEALQCPDGEGWRDQVCPWIRSYLGCTGCKIIPDTADDCEDEHFPFPTCQVLFNEWGNFERFGAASADCACLVGRIQAQG